MKTPDFVINTENKCASYCFIPFDPSPGLATVSTDWCWDQSGAGAGTGPVPMLESMPCLAHHSTHPAVVRLMNLEPRHHSTTAPQHHRTTAAAALSAGNTGHWSDVVTRFRSLHHDAQCAHHRRFSHRYMVYVLHVFLSFHIQCNQFCHFSLKVEGCRVT